MAMSLNTVQGDEISLGIALLWQMSYGVSRMPLSLRMWLKMLVGIAAIGISEHMPCPYACRKSDFICIIRFCIEKSPMRLADARSQYCILFFSLSFRLVRNLSDDDFTQVIKSRQ
jgi:hypothetical protein